MQPFYERDSIGFVVLDAFSRQVSFSRRMTEEILKEIYSDSTVIKPIKILKIYNDGTLEE